MPSASIVATLYSNDFYVNQQPGPAYDPQHPVTLVLTLHLHNPTPNEILVDGIGDADWTLFAPDTARTIASGSTDGPDRLRIAPHDTESVELHVAVANGLFRRTGTYGLALQFFGRVETRVRATIVS